MGEKKNVEFTIDERVTCIYIMGKVSSDDEGLSATRSLYERLSFSDEELAMDGISRSDNGIIQWQPSSVGKVYDIELVSNECNQLKSILSAWRGWTHETWSTLQTLKEKLTIEEK